MNNAMSWLQENLPQWPESISNLASFPRHRMSEWSWMTSEGEFFFVNMSDGEMINRTDFLNARNKQRLTPCGMSFKELIEDLSL